MASKANIVVIGIMPGEWWTTGKKWFVEGRPSYDMNMFCVYADPRTQHAGGLGLHDRPLVVKSILHPPKDVLAHGKAAGYNYGKYPAILRPKGLFYDLNPQASRFGQSAYKLGPAMKLADEYGQERGPNSNNPEIPDPNPMVAKYFGTMKEVWEEAQLIDSSKIPMLTRDIFMPWGRMAGESVSTMDMTRSAVSCWNWLVNAPSDDEEAARLALLLEGGVKADDAALTKLTDTTDSIQPWMSYVATAMELPAGKPAKVAMIDFLAAYTFRARGFHEELGHGRRSYFVPLDCLTSNQGVEEFLLPYRGFKAYEIQDLSDLEFMSGAAHISLWDNFPVDVGQENARGEDRQVSQAYVDLYGKRTVLGNERLWRYLEKTEQRRTLGKPRPHKQGEQAYSDDVVLTAR